MALASLIVMATHTGLAKESASHRLLNIWTPRVNKTLAVMFQGFEPSFYTLL